MRTGSSWSVRAGAVLIAGLVAAGAAAGADPVVVDFTDGTTNPFSAGAISAEVDGNALHVGAGVNATLDIPEAMRGKTVVVTMSVYDRGVWVTEGNETGPRWGVSAGNAADQAVAVGIVHRKFINSKTHYAVCSKNARFATPATMSAYRNRPAGAAEAGQAAEKGTWTQWTFTVTPAGIVTLKRDNQPALTPHGQAHHAESLGGPATQVFVAGGAGPLAGVYIDNVRIAEAEEPPPAP